jgi:hypothetical protein
MKRFVLNRSEDISGSSGVGIVAEGIQFTNGRVALTWRSSLTSVAIYDSIDILVKIHDHGGRTKIEWIDS